MRSTRLFVALLVFVLAVGASTTWAQAVTAADAFGRLKAMAGNWKGHPEGQGAEAEAAAEAAGEVVHEFQVSAAGTVVMETMNPGSDHEMINMYHLDGDELMLTHYCAGGNQPRMRLDRQRSTPNKLVFDFTDGTNLDPANDPHIHSAEITFGKDGGIVSMWTSFAAGKPAGVMTFHLARAE